MPLDRLPAGGGGFRPALSPIPPALREQVRQLNRAYLELLRADEEGITAGFASPPGLPALVVEMLTTLPESALGQIAECPVTLYNLRFEDAAFWAGGGTGLVADVTESYGKVGERSFVGTALFFAWHVAQSSELAARLLLAMPSATHVAFRDLPLAQLHRYAAVCPWLLQPRWANHACFWPDLLRTAAQGDQAALDAALLLGVQLAFTEVEPAAVPAKHAGAATPRHRRRR